MAKNRQKKNSTTKMGQVRIIGGDWRGRKLPVLSSEGLRPTSDRVRETLFNWLQFEVVGAHCLDLFAGSGALGLEALSRGAKSTTFLELSVPAVKQLQTNLSTLNASNAQVVQGDSFVWLESWPERGGGEKFAIIFVDPPFYQGLMQKAVDKLFIKGIILNEPTESPVWLYLEQEKELPWPSLPEGWVCYREKSTAQVRFGLFRREL